MHTIIPKAALKTRNEPTAIPMIAPTESVEVESCEEDVQFNLEPSEQL